MTGSYCQLLKETLNQKRYCRLAPNKIVRAKYLGLLKCIGYKTNELNEPIEIEVELLPMSFKPEKRVQGTINWISEIDHLNVTIVKYDHLFPLIENGDLNLNSKTIMNIMTDTSIKNAKVYDKFQFERIGYFSVDPDTTDDKLVLNMVTSLKEDKGKN